jgi:hypothetical protein
MKSRRTKKEKDAVAERLQERAGKQAMARREKKILEIKGMMNQTRSTLKE